MQNKRLLLLITFLIMATFIVSCSKNDGNKNTNIQSNGEVISSKGTIKFVKLEGGFFGILTDDGIKYKPVNLPESFQKDGHRVKFKGKLNTELMGIHMWGKLIDIKEINAL